MMTEVRPAEEGKGLTFRSRQTIETSLIFSYHPPVNQKPMVTGLELHFADAGKLTAEDLRKGMPRLKPCFRIIQGGATISPLLILLRKTIAGGGRIQMSEFVQAIVEVDSFSSGIYTDIGLPPERQ